MSRSPRIVPVLAAFAAAACSTDATGPGMERHDGRPVVQSVEGLASAQKDRGTVVVTERDITRQPENTPPTNNWVYYFRLPTSTGTFVTGPGNPPLGSGSFLMSTPTVADKGTLFNYDHIGTQLADITDISYATYRDPASIDGVALPSINIQVDKDGGALLPGDFLTLVYEPYLNGATIQEGVWQTWETIPGTWWATRPITLAGGTVCLPQVCTFSWSAFVAAHPNATIVGGFGVNQGSFNPGLIAATDALSITTNGTTITYDFELFEHAGDACKDGGWRTMTDDDGDSFRNQGQCVKYFNDKSRGA